MLVGLRPSPATRSAPSIIWPGPTGLLRLAAGDHAGARAAFSAAAIAHVAEGEERRSLLEEIDKYNPDVNRYAIFGIFYDWFDHAFCCFAFPAPIRAAEKQHYAFCVERGFNHLRPTAASAELLEQERRLNGDTMWYWICVGHVHWIAGRRDDADDAYRCARDLAIEQSIIPYHFDCGAMVWLKLSEVEVLLQPDHQIRDRLPTSTWVYRFPDRERDERQPDIALVLGCDRQYFEFYPKFLLSLIEAHLASGRRERVALHCHVAAPEPGQVDFLDDIFGCSDDIVISYSVGSAAFDEASYYTCLRFLVLPAVLARYGCGAMALDIDSIVSSAFFDQLDAIRDADLGLRMYNFTPDGSTQVAGEPWSIGAHPTYVSNTELGCRFAGFLRAYVSAAYDPRLATNWTIDQCAIAQAYDLLVSKACRCKLMNNAYHPPVCHLPHEFGSKADLLEAGGRVTINNFRTRLAAIHRAPQACISGPSPVRR